jgi:hypothetical protein
MWIRRLAVPLRRLASVPPRSAAPVSWAHHFSTGETAGPSGSGNNGDNKWSWGWTPPANAELAGGGSKIVLGSRSSFAIPVDPGVSLTLGEVQEALEELGGLEVKAVPVKTGRLQDVRQPQKKNIDVHELIAPIHCR